VLCGLHIVLVQTARGTVTFVFKTLQDLWPTQPPIQWVVGALSPGVKLQGREADHSSQSSAEVKNVLSCTSTRPISLRDVVLKQWARLHIVILG